MRVFLGLVLFPLNLLIILYVLLDYCLKSLLHWEYKIMFKENLIIAVSPTQIPLLSVSFMSLK